MSSDSGGTAYGHTPTAAVKRERDSVRKTTTLLVLLVLWAGTLAGAPLALAQGSGTTGPTATAGAALSLGGQVTGSGGRPLVAAEVELFRFGAGRIRTTATDAAGYFRFAGLDESGVYWVRAWAQGYQVAESSWAGGNQRPFLVLTPAARTATVFVRVVDPVSGAPVGGAKVELQRSGQGQVDHGQTGPSGLVRLQALAGGGYVLRAWDAHRIPVQVELPELAGGGTRSVRVELARGTGRITGTVVAAPGDRPLAGAVVQAVRPGHGVAAADRTGTGGSFSLAVPAGAEYQVRVHAPGYAGSQTAPFRLIGGIGQDFSGEQRIALTPATASLAGRLLDDRGSPVAGRTVQVQRQPLGTIASAVTDTDGRFRITDLPARPGVQYRAQVLPAENNWWPATTAWVELAGGRTTEVQLQMAKMVPPNMGTAGQITGTVTDTAGQPLADIQLDLWQAGQGSIRTATSAADGSFDLGKVPPNRLPGTGSPTFGAYHVVATANGRFTTTLAAAGTTVAGAGAATAAAESSIDVLPSRITHVNIVLHDRWVAASGQVADHNGQPLAGARVELQPVEGGSLLLATTDESGHWTVAQIPPLGSFRVQAAKVGYLTGVGADLVPDGTAGRTRDLVLRPDTVEVSGQVSDPIGAPLAGATVTVRGAGFARTAITDASGYYALRPPPGRALMMAAEADGYGPSGMGPVAPVPSVAASDPGAALAVDLRLWPPAGQVAGTVLGPDGQPLPTVAVELVREGHGVAERLATDRQGRYEFAEVPAGSRYAVRPVDRQYRYLDANGLPRLFTLSPGTVANVHVEAGPPVGRDAAPADR